jgi:hypothetical protein
LEADGGAYQPEEWMEGVGDMPAKEELTEDNLSEEESEQQLSDETIGMEVQENNFGYYMRTRVIDDSQASHNHEEEV